MTKGTLIKVDRTKNYASFELENGMGIAIDFTNPNDSFHFKTSNMRFGNLENDKDLLENDIKLLHTVNDYIKKYMSFKVTQRADTRVDKVKWFIQCRLPLFTTEITPELERNILLTALGNIPFHKDKYGSTTFSMKDIDATIEDFLKQLEVS